MPRVATRRYSSGVPNAPKTPARQVRMSNDNWGDIAEAAKVADLRGGSDIINALVDWYLRRPGAKLPERLSVEELARIAAMPYEVKRPEKQTRNRRSTQVARETEGEVE